MTIYVNIGEAKTRLSQLVAAALRGEDVVLQKAGEPKVRLVPISEAAVQEAQARAARRAAAIGFARAKYAHLPPEAFDVAPATTDEDLDERKRREFDAPPA